MDTLSNVNCPAESVARLDGMESASVVSQGSVVSLVSLDGTAWSLVSVGLRATRATWDSLA